jgi:hypothetical protein
LTRRIRVCPKCASSKISEAQSSVSGWLVPTTFFCEETKCDYSGPVYVEVDIDELDRLRDAMNGDSSDDE